MRVLLEKNEGKRSVVRYSEMFVLPCWSLRKYAAVKIE